MTMKNIMLGIDIGGTNTVFGFVLKSSKVIEEFSIPTKAKKPAEELVKRVKIVVDEFLAKNSEKYKLKGIGVGAPNANYYTGMIENPPNLKWGSVNLVKVIEKYFQVPVKITNDANASALGELVFGAGKGMKSFIAITLGTGLGSGIVVDGKLLYGTNGLAGELGHVCIDFHGRHCGCGKRGCLECYVSAPGIVRTAIELSAKLINETKIREIPTEELSAKNLSEIAKKGDTVALEIFDYTARLLGVSLANVGMILSPEAFIICGGLAKSGDLLLKRTKEYMEAHLIDNFKDQIEILPSGISNGNSAVIGASALAWNEFYNK